MGGTEELHDNADVYMEGGDLGTIYQSTMAWLKVSDDEEPEDES